MRTLALEKIVEYLRNAGGLFNKIHVSSPGEICQLEEFCQLYFNLLSLFFPSSVNVTVWTIAYASLIMQNNCMKIMELGLEYFPYKQKSPNTLVLKLNFL